MKSKKWIKCLLMTMALMVVFSAGTISETNPVVAKTGAEAVKKGTKFWKGKLQYKVTSLKGKKGTATLIGAKSKVTSVNVPRTVKVDSCTLTVTAIGANAFTKCRNLKKVVTNTELKKIGKNAFSGCKKLVEVDIRSKKLKTVGKNALSEISKAAVITVPEGKGASYEKLLKVEVQTPDDVKTTEAPETEISSEAEETEKITEKAAEEAGTKAVSVKETVSTKAPAEETAPTSAPKVNLSVPKKTLANTMAPTQTETKIPTSEASTTTQETSAPTKAETPAQTETETPKTKAQTEAETLAQTEMKVSETKAQTEAETPAPTETEAPETKAQTEAETPAQTETEAPETKAQTEAETPAQTETETPKTKAQTEAETLAQTEMKVSETKAQTEAETPAPTETEAPETKAQTEAETPVPTETEAPETKAQTEAETPAPTETKAPETKAQTEAETPAPTETEAPETKAQVETETPAPTETEAPETKAQTEAETSAPTGTEAPETKAQTEAETPAPTETEAPETKAQTEAETPAPTETEAPETKAQTEPETPAQTEAETPAPTPETEVRTEVKAPKKAKGTKAQAQKETPAETEHVCEFTWVVTKEPYCGYLGNDMTWRDTGSRTGTCAVCGKTVTEGLRAEHKFEVTKDVAPTCTERGAKYSKCTVCGYQSISLTDENGKIRKALGHDMVHYEDPATCTEDGRKYDKCSRCGLVENEEITAPKTGHDFSVSEEETEGDGQRSDADAGKRVSIVKEATCVQDGQKEIACAHEGCTAKRFQRIPATGHEFEETHVAATCTEDEKTVKRCVNCGSRITTVVSGTRLGHKLKVMDEPVPSTTTVQGYELQECQNDGCDYTEKTILPLATHEHNWVHVSGQEGEKEGILASMSHGKMRTEKCTAEGCHELRYTYHTAELGSECGADKDCGHWVPWEEVPCNGKGHTWVEGSENCTVCGMEKPASEKDDKKGASRIVWSVYIEIWEDGAKVSEDQPTTISADHCIDYTAPERAGYTFKGWTWSKSDEEIPDELFSDKETKRALHIPWKYMNVVFTARYVKETAPASKEQESTEAGTPISMEMPKVIHDEMHVDLSGVLDGDAEADDSAPEDHVIIEHEEPVVAEHHDGMVQ